MELLTPQNLIPLAAIALGLGLLGWQAVRGRGPKRDELPAGDVTGDARELMDRLAVELDARAERLERLIARADDRIRSLESRTPGRTAQAAPAPAVEPKPRPAEVAPGHREVHELADRGLSPVQIAQRTGRPTGEVELVLSLRRHGI